MSTLKVEVIKIDSIEVHPNADRLELANIAGWQCVVQKGKFIPDQPVVYIPIDSILPNDLESHLFPPESKVKLTKSRIRTIKLRGAVSQGMVLSIGELREGGFLDDSVKIGDDLAENLGITKYEPPEISTPQYKTNAVKPKRYKNPNFKEYTKIENFKWYPDLFKEGEEVVIQEKIHGSSFRAGYVEFHADTWWKKVKKFLKLAPEYEFVYGSHKVQLQNKPVYNGFYSENIYLGTVEKYELEKKLNYGEVIYGEIYGPKIQKDYHYGCQEGEYKLVLFDVQRHGKYINHAEFVDFCHEVDLPYVPVEYVGPYTNAKEIKEKWVDGKSTLCPEQEVREGVVIKPLMEQHCYMGRKILKYKSDEFLMSAEDDTH